jgi:hypothetical protein
VALRAALSTTPFAGGVTTVLDREQVVVDRETWEYLLATSSGGVTTDGLREALRSLIRYTAGIEHGPCIDADAMEHVLSTTPPAPEGLREAIRAALNELGVPGPGYPMPVANAVAILEAALSTTPPSEGQGS